MMSRAAMLGWVLTGVWMSAAAGWAAESGAIFQPGIEMLTGYNDRPTGSTDSWYSEAGVTFRHQNRPARLDLSASGSLHERFNRFFEKPEDYRYSLQAAIGSSDGRFQWRISPAIRKVFSANSTYNTETGALPDDYLRNESVIQRRISGTVSYRLPVSDGTKTELIPYYSGHHIDEERSDQDEQRRQHEAGVRAIYRYSERTGLTAEGAGQLQSGNRDKGRIARVAVGVQWQYSDKTSFSGSLGWTSASYDESGSAQSPYFNVRCRWLATEKVSGYVFGDNAFRPSIGGDAEMVWRFGYGTDWRPVDSLSASLQLLHQMEEPLGNGNEDSRRTDYLTAGLQKKINKQLAAFSRIRYVLQTTDENDSKLKAESGIRWLF